MQRKNNDSLTKTAYVTQDLKKIYRREAMLGRIMRKSAFTHTKMKAQISSAVIAKPISVFVFVSDIHVVQYLYFINSKEVRALEPKIDSYFTTFSLDCFIRLMI